MSDERPFTIESATASVRVAGRVDRTVIRTFCDELRSALERSASHGQRVVVDLTAIETIGPLALSELARADARSRREGGHGLMVRAPVHLIETHHRHRVWELLEG